VSSDVSLSYKTWMNDDCVFKYTEQRFFLHSYESLFKFVAQKFYSNHDYLFGIFYDDVHIGNIKLGPIDYNHMTAEISYFIGNIAYRELGIATKAISRVISFAKTELNIRKINAVYYRANKASAKVLQKLGFIIEGIQKDQRILNGEAIDLVYVGLFTRA
jgi:ribosomal-protein-alanine N-acetyltransferase